MVSLHSGYMYSCILLCLFKQTSQKLYAYCDFVYQHRDKLAGWRKWGWLIGLVWRKCPLIIQSMAWPFEWSAAVLCIFTRICQSWIIKCQNINWYNSIYWIKINICHHCLVPPSSFLHKQLTSEGSTQAAMKVTSIVVLLLGLAVSELLAESSGDSGGTSLTKLSYSRWINLLRYAHKTLQREPVSNHTDHINRTEHVQLISDRIRKHFFNDQIRRKFVIYKILFSTLLFIQTWSCAPFLRQ